MAKILIFDIETAPDLAQVWRYFKNNVGLNQVVDDGWIMSFSAKWLGEDDVVYVENRKKNDKRLVKALLELIDEADIVIGHNGKQFDMGWLRAKAAIHGFPPPSPVKIIDTLIESRKLFKFPSYKLEYLLRRFGVGEKYAHKKFPGHDLWMECYHGNDEAWEEMREYNIQDTIGLEKYYLKIRPWIANHPNIGVYAENDVPTCSKCGGTNMKKDGYVNTNLSKFQQYRCTEKHDGVVCGGWARGRKNLLAKDKRDVLLTNAL